MFHFRSVFGRLSFTFLLVVVLAFGVLALTTPQVIRNSAIESERSTLMKRAESIVQFYIESYNEGDTGSGLQKGIDRITGYDSISISIIDKFGVPIWKSDTADMSPAGEKLAEESVASLSKTAISGESATNVQIVADETSTPIVTAAVAIKSDSSVLGCVVCSAAMNSLSSVMSGYYGQLLMAGSLAVIIALGLAAVTARRIERPLGQISKAAGEIAKGHFDKRLDMEEMNEVSELAATFNSMAEELEKYENTRSSFVANVSHELKSPLTSIQGFVQGVLDGTISEADRTQYLTIVLDETKRLNTLIADLLDLAKIESGQFPLHRTEWDINELLRQCIIRFITKIEDKNLDVSVELSEDKIIVDADKDRMTQVITNIIDNGVKFAEEGGSLKIWTDDKGDRIEVNIANSGEIIPEDDLPYVFDRFFKVDKSHNRKAKGTGIGLSIVRNIILQHDEKIWVNSKEGTGTVFTFTVKKAAEKKKK